MNSPQAGYFSAHPEPVEGNERLDTYESDSPYTK
jgi:hypothetical protein